MHTAENSVQPAAKGASFRQLLPALRGGAILLCAAAVDVAMRLGGAPAIMADSMGLVLFAIGFWALGILPEALTGLLFLLGAVVLAGHAPQVAFSGYTGSAFWLIFAGAVLGAAASRTGLSRRIAGLVIAPRFHAVGYGTHIALIVGFSTALALILPSTLARVVLMLPIAVALADRLGYAADGRGRVGLILAATIGSYMVPITFLPANLPTVVLAGSLEKIYAITPTYGRYLLIHFPVIGIIKGVALVVLLRALFHETPRPEAVSAATSSAEPLSPAARRLMLVLAATLALWTTDTLHGISPAWIGLGSAIVCLLPATRIITLKELPSESMFPTLLYVGAVLGIGGILSQSGAGAALAEVIVQIMPLADVGDGMRLVLLTLGGAVTGLVSTMPVAPAISAPLFGEIATATGWSVEAVGMAQVLAYAAPLLPYQLPPLIWAIAATGISLWAVTRVLLILAVVTTPLTLLAAHFWWPLLGLY